MRIVSLAPSHTETLFALGLGEYIVGVTVHCDYPPQAAPIFKVGPFASPDSAAVLSLRPDLVIAGGSLHLSCVRDLRQAGITVLSFYPRTVSDLLEAMEEITRMTKTGKAGGPAVAVLREKLSLINEKTADQTKPKAVFIMGEQQLMTPGPASFQYDAMRTAGAALIPFSDYVSYVPITWKYVVDYDPEIILACGRSQGEPRRKRCPGCNLVNRPCDREVESIINNPLLGEVAAIRAGHVHTIPCHLLCRAGPRLLDGMGRLVELFKINA